MNIIYSTDENYAKIFLASIWSLLESNKDTENLKIYLIDNKIKKETKQKMIELVQKYNRKIIFISCEEICKDLEKNNDFPVSSYARLFIQDYVKEEKVIYLDCDVIVMRSLEEMWKINLKENWIGGVQDPLPEYLKQAIEMKKEDRYINAGVLIINLKKWREIDFKKQVIKYIKEHKKNVVHHDQGIINGICKGRILYLEPKFNLMPEMIMMNEKQLKKIYKMEKFYTDNELENAKNNPYIVHYIAKFYNRPWFKECTHPLKEEFLKYYRKLDGEIKNKPLGRKIRMRRFVFKYLPFNLYVMLERILDYRRKRHSIKLCKGK